MLSVRSFSFNPLAANTYVLASQGEAAIVDATAYDAGELDALAAHLDAEGLTVRHLLLTHGHVDHVFACDALADRFGLGWQMHRGDQTLLSFAPATAQMFGLAFPTRHAPTVETWLQEGDRILLGDTALDVLHVPGHSPGSVAFHAPAEGLVVTGDALFRGSIGRTDLPGGDLPTLLRAIETRLLVLPDDTAVHPGHGGPSIVGEERRTNPFLI